MPTDRLELPLVPVSDEVCFPHVELSVDLDADAGRLLAELACRPPEQRLVGVVLLRPAEDWRQAAGFSWAGTLVRLEDVEHLPGGGACARLRGLARFEVEEVLSVKPFRSARVRLLEEPVWSEREVGICALRHRLSERLVEAAQAVGGDFPLPAAALTAALEAPFEELVNRVAQALDVPPLRKLELLAEPLPQRAHEVLGILRSRIKLAELLRPFRHLCVAAEHN